MWVKYFSRGMSMQKALDYAYGEGKVFFDFFGTQLFNHLYIKNGENIDIYYQDNEFKDLLHHLAEELKSKSFFTKFYNGVELLKSNVNKIEKLLTTDLNKSPKILMDYVLKVRELRSEYYPMMWYNVVFESKMEEIFLKVMKKYPKLDTSIFLVVDRPTFIVQEEIDLLKLAQNFSSASLEKHFKKHAFIAMYDYDYKPYNIKYFKERLAKIKNPEVKLREINLDFKVKNKKYKEVLSKVNKEDRKFLEFFHFSMWFKDERSKFRNYESYICRPLYKKIADSLKISTTELLNLTYEEMQKALMAGKVDKRIIQSRNESFALITSPNDIKILDKKETEKFLRKLKIRSSEDVRGICAAKGKVKGVVKIVLSSKSVDKVNSGDILMSPMTRPDFIQAMKKASAIVTDEGGLTCHAAIVSRELNVPCVIGTKIATQVFKDGDMVEVDANNGIVRKI